MDDRARPPAARPRAARIEPSPRRPSDRQVAGRRRPRRGARSVFGAVVAVLGGVGQRPDAAGVERRRRRRGGLTPSARVTLAATAASGAKTSAGRRARSCRRARRRRRRSRRRRRRCAVERTVRGWPAIVLACRGPGRARLAARSSRARTCDARSVRVAALACLDERVAWRPAARACSVRQLLAARVAPDGDRRARRPATVATSGGLRPASTPAAGRAELTPWRRGRARPGRRGARGRRPARRVVCRSRRRPAPRAAAVRARAAGDAATRHAAMSASTSSGGVTAPRAGAP